MKAKNQLSQLSVWEYFLEEGCLKVPCTFANLFSLLFQGVLAVLLFRDAVFYAGGLFDLLQE